MKQSKWENMAIINRRKNRQDLHKRKGNHSKLVSTAVNDIFILNTVHTDYLTLWAVL